ncbi:ATP-grasp domain-containing protein [Devosia algicola]|uniref:ATP-grasp domain-containing protein n=1 Tax=Devosia algicola TaxID=3026418 RepID=A0ABY7YM55_9HYPH|nr:ATP-grasp domain-containing protein [Devosia algicola]WDR02343.1 ATP-grasp domain-containing protein [Devosia algicola]
MINVLVTGVGGGGVGEQLIKALGMSTLPMRVIGTDLDVDVAKHSGADGCHSLPRASDPAYVEKLLGVCRQERVDVVLPGSEPELRAMAASADEIRANVTMVAVNDANVIATCSDKFETTRFLVANGFDCPQSWLIEALVDLDEVNLFPLIVKPTVGGGSQNVYLIQNDDELRMIVGFLLRYYDAVLLQEYVGRVDQEYTVGVLFDGNGNLINSIALNRFILTSLSNRIRVPNNTGRADLGDVLAVSSGVSQGRVEAYDMVRHHCEKVGAALGAKYAINVQCRVADGKVMIFEINPRFSGTSSIRAMLGFNEPDLLIRKHVLGEDISDTPPYRFGTVLRGLKETLV